jgi:predicted ester cyclase
VSELLPPTLQRMLALWNGEGIDPAHVYADPCTVDGGRASFGPLQVAEDVRALRSAAPDMRFELEDHVRVGGRHVLRLVARGTHTGEPFRTEIGDAPARGAELELRGIEVFELRDDRIVDVWLGWNFAGLYAALGARL